MRCASASSPRGHPGIARYFGVAIATATEALAALRQEGPTHARPGVGDEWMRTLGPVEPRLPEFELDLDLLVRFGLRSLLDGLQVLVDRRAAA